MTNKGDKKNLKYVQSEAALARELGISQQTANRVIRQDGLPKTVAGYSLALAREMLESRRRRNDDVGGVSPLALTMKEKKLEAEATIKQLEAGELAGLLVPKEKVERDWNRKLTHIKNRMKALGRELAPKVHGEPLHAIADIINQRVNELLTELSEPEYEEKTTDQESPTS